MNAERLTRSNLLSLARRCGGQAKTSGRIVLPSGEDAWPGDLVVWDEHEARVVSNPLGIV